MDLGPATDRAAGKGLLERYAAFLPITPTTPLITLGEGNTPLVRSPRLEEQTGAREVWLKLEGCNPTGSFKDRGMAMAVAKALEDGSHTIICASTGNTSAAAAAFAARTGLLCVVVVSAANVALGKLVQARAYGASVISIKAEFDEGLKIVRELAERPGVTLVNSLNKHRLEGQKTAAFELCDFLGHAPDEVYIPVGNAGNISAYWMGFCQYLEAGKINSTPAMRGFQAEGAAPIVYGRPVAKPQTVASALRIGNPANWERAVHARDESSGSIEAVSDEEIMRAYRALAAAGFFCEPASAAAVAGLLDRSARGLIERDSVVVCVVTGSGLKDPQLAAAEFPPIVEAEPTAAAVAGLLRW